MAQRVAGSAPPCAGWSSQTVKVVPSGEVREVAPKAGTQAARRPAIAVKAALAARAPTPVLMRSLLERVLQVDDVADVERAQEVLQGREVGIELLQLAEVVIARVLVSHQQIDLAEQVVAVLDDVLVVLVAADGHGLLAVLLGALELLELHVGEAEILVTLRHAARVGRRTALSRASPGGGASWPGSRRPRRCTADLRSSGGFRASPSRLRGSPPGRGAPCSGCRGSGK